MVVPINPVTKTSHVASASSKLCQEQSKQLRISSTRRGNSKTLLCRWRQRLLLQRQVADLIAQIQK